MRTFFWTFTLFFSVSTFVSAQDLAQLRKAIEDNIPAVLPDDLGYRIPSRELIDACQAVVDAANQIYALPDLDDQDRHWTLRREAIARILLVYVDAPAHYTRLAHLSDELEKLEARNVAKLTEEHVLKAGILLATQTGANTMNVCPQALAERMVMFAEQYPGRESLQIIELFLQQVRRMRASHRDRRLAVIAPIFQEYFKTIYHTHRVAALEPDIQRATLPGNQMRLVGVDLEGRDFDPATLRDKVVLLQFWGTWCGPCKQEIPELIALYEKYRADGFEIIGINTGTSGDDERRVRQFIDTTLFDGKKIPWKILHEGLSERKNNPTITKFYGIDELPTLILIGRDGKVLNLHPLPATLDQLIANATAPQFEWTEEEKKQIEERERKEQEEINRQLEQIRVELSAPR